MKRLAHHSDLVLAAGQALYVASNLLDLAWRDSWVGTGLLIASTGVLLLGVNAMLHHQARPCEQCIADMPLDAQAQVERKQLSLWLFHRLNSRPAFAAWFVLVVASFLVPREWQPVLLTVFGLFNLANWLMTWRHRPLQPVCPWCRWRGWDDLEKAPEPTPDPAGTKAV